MNKRPNVFKRTFSRAMGALGFITQDNLYKQVREAEIRAFEFGGDSGNDEPALRDSAGRAISARYRSMTDTPRDLSGISQELAIESSYRLWNTHPLAKALIEIPLDYIVAGGIVVTSDNEEVQAIIDDFMDDDVNDFNGDGIHEIVRELSLFGEQLILLFIRDVDGELIGDGRVRIGTIDPSMIYSIITDKDNQRDFLAVRIKDESGGIKGPVYRLVKSKDNMEIVEGKPINRRFFEGVNKLREYTTARESLEDGEKPVEIANYTHALDVGKEYRVHEAEGRNGFFILDTGKAVDGIKYDGQCFLFQVNKLSTGMRGRPDLLPSIDWLDRFDQLFFDGAEHVALLNMFAWDLMIEGGKSDTTNREINLTIQAQTVANLKPGSVYAHNQKTKLEPINPSLHTGDLETIFRQLRIFIAGGQRIPEHWIAEGGYTNRATAAEMGEPTFKMLANRQRFVSNIITKLVQFQIDVKVALNKLPEKVEVTRGVAIGDEVKKTETVFARDAFIVIMPDLSTEDTTKSAAALASVSSALITLVSGRIITRKVAVEAVANVLLLFGLELDVSAILEDLETDETEMEDKAPLKDLMNMAKELAAGSKNGDKKKKEDEVDKERINFK